LSDSSEFGHLINALTGYEASPNAMQVIIHMIALLIPLIIVGRIKLNHPYKAEVTT
jgi:high-affinity iron transporter